MDWETECQHCENILCICDKLDTSSVIILRKKCWNLWGALISSNVFMIEWADVLNLKLLFYSTINGSSSGKFVLFRFLFSEYLYQFPVSFCPFLKIMIWKHQSFKILLQHNLKFNKVLISFRFSVVDNAVGTQRVMTPFLNEVIASSCNFVFHSYITKPFIKDFDE